VTEQGELSERAPVGQVVEIDSVRRFDELVAGGARRMRGWRVRGVDLRRRTPAVLALDPDGGLLLGCRLTRRADEYLRGGGAVVFPTLPDAPVDAYRSTLYTADELYAGLRDGYEATPDARIYAWSQAPRPRAVDAATKALHDAAIEEALDELVAGRRVVGVMGGHAAARGSSEYRNAARLGRALGRAGALVATGGGPGAMEAANLGASLAAHPDAALDAALAALAAVPSFRPSVRRWAEIAMEVRDRWPGDGGLGIPTWFYGYEPTNVFAAVIAKLFLNSLREAALVRRCDGGIAYLPGAAGTVQEVFQDACENYYADLPTVAPMVLVGTDHWTTSVPAWPLLRALAAGRPMEGRTAIVAGVDEAVNLLGTDPE
jgi:predicted Rossmann-fold nucleotide-binding protein